MTLRWLWVGLWGVLALGGGCSGVATEPAGDIIGLYDATESVTITLTNGMSLGTVMTRLPLTIVHGDYSAAVVNDGMCVIPADAVNTSDLLLHSNTTCDRVLTGGGAVTLIFTAGTANVTARELQIMARGSFTFAAQDQTRA